MAGVVAFGGSGMPRRDLPALSPEITASLSLRNPLTLPTLEASKLDWDRAGLLGISTSALLSFPVLKKGASLISLRKSARWRQNLDRPELIMTSPRPFGSYQPSMELSLYARMTLALLGTGVIFACLGLGEAVYRIAFFEFDGATDRLPLEMLSGLMFAWLATNLARKIYQRRLESRARIRLIKDRNRRIRQALGAIAPVSLPGHQQAIRVIREEVDRIDMALSDILPHSEERLFSTD